MVASLAVTRPIRGPWTMAAASDEATEKQVKYENRRTVVKRSFYAKL